ncbi:MAG: hypothetical protein ACI92E_002568 [Oceanicoccus sp.]|jgi:hypothetical protein
MNNLLQTVPVWHGVDTDTFQREIAPLNKPAHLKSLVGNWPAVKKGILSPVDLATYLKKLDNGTPTGAAVAEPSAKGRFYYSGDLQGVNFKRTQVTLTIAIDRLLKIFDHTNPYAIAIQAVPIAETLPGFIEDNRQPLLDEPVAPTLWLSNKSVVAPHYDIFDNIACVVAGARKFTVFPPNQINNLYVGPILDAPGGVPISMVDVREPDLAKFPNYSKALDVAQEAVLEPGDAIYIPGLWWHAVESLENLNVLVNYWWGGMSDNLISPNDSLLHSMLTIAKLSPAQRQGWRDLFDYYVFQTSGDPAAHLPQDITDIVTSLNPEQKKRVLSFLSERLK